MVDGPEVTVAFRLWPPVAIGAPLLVGWLVTLLWGDPVGLGGWRVPLGWVLVLLFVGWNGWSLWLFGRHETGLLPGQATHAMIEEGPYRLSRNPLYVGLLALYLGLALLAPTFWGLVLFPAAVLLVLWGAIRPEERFLHERFGAPYDDYTRRVRRWLCLDRPYRRSVRAPSMELGTTRAERHVGSPGDAAATRRRANIRTCRISVVILVVKPIAGHDEEGDRRAPRPGRCGCRRGPRSTSRSSPTALLRAPG
jgi:protein-S-isoprenylcysteine O-methyltransferase Ste14